MVLHFPRRDDLTRAVRHGEANAHHGAQRERGHGDAIQPDYENIAASGGMAQRTALARALVNDPKLLILDEPLGQLDSLTRLAMQSELVSLWERSGFTALLVTHDVEEALFLAGRVILLTERPAHIKAEIVNDLSYPRHRGDPHLAELRHQVFTHLGLDATW